MTVIWFTDGNATLQIEQLQLRLQEEKSMRDMLERAMGRASSTLSPGHRHFSVQVITSLYYFSLKNCARIC